MRTKILYTALISSLFVQGLLGQILVYDDHSIQVSATVSCMHFSGDSRFLASGTEKGMILIWDLEARKMLHELKHGAAVNSVYIDSKSRYVVSGGASKEVIIWDLYTGEKVRSIRDYKGKINHIGISPDEKMMSIAGSRKEIYLVQFPEGTVSGMLRNGHQKEVIFSAFNQAGNQLVSVGKDNQMIFWDTGNKQVLRKSDIAPRTINESGIEVQTAGITPDRRKVVIAFRETRLAKGGNSMMFRYNTASYDWQTGMLGTIVEGNVKNIEAFSITPDGRYYITDNSTNRLKKINFWDLESGQVVKNQQIGGEVSALTVADQGTLMALAEERGKTGESGGIKVLRVSGLGSSPPAQAYTGKGQEAGNLPVAQSNPFVNSGSSDFSVLGKYHALIIGINEYKDPKINDLEAPLNDARQLLGILSTSYSFDSENIVFLENPSRAEIIDALDYLENSVSPEDNLLIFYAGHGHWDENTHKGYWLPSDASHESTANWLRNSSLTGYISSIQSKHTLLIADACFAGSIFKTRAAFSQTSRAIQRLYDIPSRKAMTSGTLKEVPDESVFLRFLMKRLEENEMDYLPSEQLFFSLKPAVLNNSHNVPQFGEVKDAGDEGGDFIFVKRK